MAAMAAKFIFLLCIVILTSLTSLPHFRTKSHKRYILTSKRILKKIRSFNGSAKEARILAYLRKINPYVFEELLLTVFEEQGYHIKRNPRYSNDGGIDGIVFLNNRKFLIQAKRYKTLINGQHVEKFTNKVSNMNANGGFFIHTGRTSKVNYNMYRHSNITILSGEKLIKFIS